MKSYTHFRCRQDVHESCMRFVFLASFSAEAEDADFSAATLLEAAGGEVSSELEAMSRRGCMNLWGSALSSIV